MLGMPELAVCQHANVRQSRLSPVHHRSLPGGAGTIMGYQYTWASVTAIALSAVLGLAVSLSTFLVIGAVGKLLMASIILPSLRLRSRAFPSDGRRCHRSKGMHRPGLLTWNLGCMVLPPGSRHTAQWMCK